MICIYQIREKNKNIIPKKNRYQQWKTLEIKERYKKILDEILASEKIFFRKEKNTFHVDYLGEKGVNFYPFYLDYLSNKEYENTLVRVADNGVDYKEVTMKQLKEDINKIRDEK